MSASSLQLSNTGASAPTTPIQDESPDSNMIDSHLFGLPSPPSVFGSTKRSSRRSRRDRPAALNIEKANAPLGPEDAPEPSPRAAIVAELRSATDRRHQQRDQQIREEYQQLQAQLQQQYIQQQTQSQLQIQQQQQQQQMLLLQQQMRLQTLSFNDPKGTSTLNSGDMKANLGARAPMSPPSSPMIVDPSSAYNSQQLAPQLAGLNDRADPRLIATLQAKQQELLAASALIAHQQQRIQLAMNMNQAILSYGQSYPCNEASPNLGFNSPTLYQPQPNARYINTYNTDLPAPPGPGGYYPSPSVTSPMSPRKLSFGSRSQHKYNSSLGSQVGENTNSPKTPSFPHHSPTNSFGAGQLRNHVTGTPGLVSSGSKVGGGDYDMPIRQPIGPPPLDELKTAKSSSNFATIYTLIHSDSLGSSRIASQ